MPCRPVSSITCPPRISSNQFTRNMNGTECTAHLPARSVVRQCINRAHAPLTLDVHPEVLLDLGLEQAEARCHVLLLRQHHEEVEPRIVAELRCDVDVPAIPLPRAND